MTKTSNLSLEFHFANIKFTLVFYKYNDVCGWVTGSDWEERSEWG